MTHLVATTLLLTSLSTGQVDPRTSGTAGTLRLANGDELTGQLLPASGPERVRWQTPPFEDALVFDRRGVERVVLDAGGASTRPVEHRVLLRDGRFLVGDLVGLDERHVVLDGERHGRVRVLRQYVSLIESVGQDSTMLVDGGRGLSEWQSPETHFSRADWKYEKGVFATSRRGASLYRPFDVDGKVLVELELEADETLAFRVTIGAGRDPLALRTGFSLETWGKVLVAHRQTGEEIRFEKLGSIETGSQRLTVLLDAAANSVDVYSDGKLLGRFRDDGPRLSSVQGLFLRNLGEGLRVRGLRAKRWVAPSSGAPGSEAQGAYLADGTVLSGRVVGLRDGKLVVAGKQETREAELAKVDVVRLGSLGRSHDGSETAPGTVRVSYSDGCALEGSLIATDTDGIRVSADFAVEPILLGFTDARQIEFPGSTADDSPPPLGELVTEAGRLHGTLSGQATAKGRLSWLPAFSSVPVAVSWGDPELEILYPEPAARDGADSADVLYLANGDIVPVRFLGVENERYRVEIGGRALDVEARFVKGVRLRDESDGAREIASDGWRASGDGNVDAGRISLPAGASVSRKLDWPRRCRLRFRVRWQTAGSLNVTFSQRGGRGGLQRLGFFPGEVAGSNETFVLSWRNGRLQAQSMRAMFRGGLVIENSVFEVASDTAAKEVEFEVLVDRDRGRVLIRGDGEVLLSEKLRQSSGEITGLSFAAGGADEAFGEVVQIVNGRLITTAQRADVPPISIRDVELRRWPGFLDEEPLKRVLTRRRGAEPEEVSHLIRSYNGDCLRGALVGVDSENVRLRVRSRTISVPRASVAEIIALTVESTARVPAIEVGLVGGHRVSLTALQEAGGRWSATSAALGEFELSRADARRVGFGLKESRSFHALASWNLLEPVPLPVTSCPAPGDGAPGAAPTEPASPLVGKEAPDFDLARLTGGRVRPQDLRGKVVVLDFWATWCAPCVAALPTLMKVAKAHSDNVVLVAIDQQEESETIREFLKQKAWDLDVALDSDGRVGRSYGVQGIPQTVVIDPQGIVRHVHVGLAPDLEARLTREVRALISAPPKD